MKKRGPTASDQDRMLLAELLVRFRVNEITIGASLVIDDVQAKKLLAAFSLCPLPAWRRPRIAQPESDRELWDWIWRGFQGGPNEPHFLQTLSAAAGVAIQTAESKWIMLRTSRLVYPDGTLSEMGSQVLLAFCVQHLPKNPAPQQSKGGKDGK